eukprot:166542-Prymnesium_polylepis.1
MELPPPRDAQDLDGAVRCRRLHARHDRIVRVLEVDDPQRYADCGARHAARALHLKPKQTLAA